MTALRPGRAPALGAVAALVLLALSGPAAGRVISYAPLTNRPSVPALQKRTNRHALIAEQTRIQSLGIPPSVCIIYQPTRLVLHDSLGLEEPRDVTPPGQDAEVVFAAVREEAGSPPVLLAYTLSADSLGGHQGDCGTRFFFSSDGGASWSDLGLYDPPQYSPSATDVGGPFVLSRVVPARIGTRAAPFLLSLSGGLWDVLADGSVRRRLSLPQGSTLIGMDAAGERALVAGTIGVTGPGGSAARGLWAVNANGGVQALSDLPTGMYPREGWITPDGRAYVEADTDDSAGTRHAVVLLAANGGRTELLSAPNPDPTSLFAVPTADFSGAWILERDTGPTVLSLHTQAEGLVEAWRDETRPQVEALHAGASGKRLLVQVRHPRPQADGEVLSNPALAVWEVGTPAPATYDQLFVNEQFLQAFVHVDADAVSSGEPFLFDGTASLIGFAQGHGYFADDNDVVQDWGVVRGSLAQRLVIPANARVDGANGSRWRTDLVLRNPDPDPVSVGVRLLPNPGTAAAVPDASVTLAGGAILTVSDVLASLFRMESGSGALLLTPETGRSISATSRTFTSTPAGSYGMSVGAVDVFAGIGAGFPVSFAAGLLGPGFRTNVLATDVSGRGAHAALALSADVDGLSAGVASLSPPAFGQTQVNDLASALGAPSSRTGSILVTPQSGQSIVGAIAIDGPTNDPTYFPPDQSARAVHTIPAIVHSDGQLGSAFRSDLFLFNPADWACSVNLFVKRWSASEPEQTLTVSLLPHESRTLKDALFTVFGRTGVARLRFESDPCLDGSGGVRITSRTYTAAPSGGTYGLILPPLNAFETAGGGESLEILLPAGGSGFRTNLALVELTAYQVSGPLLTVTVEVFDEHGVRLDRFETPLPLAGGVQINDLFHAHGLGDGPPAGLIRISPSGGLVAAYASVIDNGTNDPMYVAASLAAKN